MITTILLACALATVPVVATDVPSFQAALRLAVPGSTIQLAPGKYTLLQVAGRNGTSSAPITICAQDPANPPVIEGGSVGMLMTDSSYITVKGLRFLRQSGNGINARGSTPGATHHIVFEDIWIEDVGIGQGQGSNADGFHLGNLADYTIRRSTVTGWTGEAIDQVHCVRGIVEDSRILAKPGTYSFQGIQAKGGSTDITIRRVTITGDSANAQFTGVSMGGSTGLQFMYGAAYEAERITLEDSTITGGRNAISFDGSKDCIARRNVVLFPTRAIMYIWRNNIAAQIQNTRDGHVLNNVFIYRKADLTYFVASRAIYTNPETFEFRGNTWIVTDNGGVPWKPVLPSAEIGGTYLGVGTQ